MLFLRDGSAPASSRSITICFWTSNETSRRSAFTTIKTNDITKYIYYCFPYMWREYNLRLPFAVSSMNNQIIGALFLYRRNRRNRIFNQQSGCTTWKYQLFSRSYHHYDSLSIIRSGLYTFVHALTLYARLLSFPRSIIWLFIHKNIQPYHSGARTGAALWNLHYIPNHIPVALCRAVFPL